MSESDGSGVEQGKEFAKWRCLSLCEKLGKAMPTIEWVEGAPGIAPEMHVAIPNERPRRIGLARDWLEDPRCGNGSRIEETIRAALRAG